MGTTIGPFPSPIGSSLADILRAEQGAWRPFFGYDRGEAVVWLLGGNAA